MVSVDWLQEVEIPVLLHTTPHITQFVCTYAVEGMVGGVGSCLEEGLTSMDFALDKRLPAVDVN